MNKIFYDKYIDKTCNLLIIKDKTYIPIFDEIYKRFMNLENKVCGFDMEFNNDKENGRYISLIQLGLFIDEKLYIIMLDTTVVVETLSYVRKLFSDTSIIKIGHGTDSLDVPAIKILLGEEDTIKFINRLYDTRFLCEYINTLTGEKLCNLYAGYSRFGAIDKEQIDFLEKNETKLGKFWMNTIHISKLSNALISYAMYDVVYLFKLLINIKSEIKKLNLDYTLCVHVTRWMILTRLKLTTLPNSNEYNTYFFNKVSLSEHFGSNIDKYIKQAPIQFATILNNQLFRKLIFAMMRPLYYLKLISTHTVYISKNIKVDKNDDKLNKIILEIDDKLIPYSSIKKLLVDYGTFIA